MAEEPQQPTQSAERAGRRRWPRTFDALAVPAYRNYFVAMAFFLGAMQATMLARPILAYDLADRAPIVLGIVLAANNAPSLVLSPFAGALADRVSMRNILIVAAGLMAAFAGITALGVVLGVLEWWHVTIIGVFQGTVMTFITPTRRAIIGGLVDERLLLNATGLHTMSHNATRTLLPLVAGIIFARAGPEWAYLLVVVL
ncbi:MAG: MFS transporter, partial [Chloroflexi bacterium]|nr:MFS transporter [Chloroflexota bacterium]